MDAQLKAALAAALGSGIASARAIAGGDINRADEIVLADGRRLFAKTNDRSPRGMFAAEARGLGWLGEAGALRIPKVAAVAAPGRPRSSSWFWSWCRPGHRRATSTKSWGVGWPRCTAMGRPAGLNHGQLHRLAAAGERHGRNHWVEFYRARRLEAQLRRAADEGRASSRMRQGFNRLFGVLEELKSVPPSRRRACTAICGAATCFATNRAGRASSTRPSTAVSREINLAMMRLFGGFGARVFDAYDEAWPLADGYRERVSLYQLYPLMVHVNLFGGGYVGRSRQRSKGCVRFATL